MTITSIDDWRTIALIAAAPATVAVGSLPVPPHFQQSANALPLAIGLGALGAAALSRWDMTCVPRRSERTIVGAFVALLALVSFTVVVQATFVTTWPILLLLAAGAFCCRLLAIVDTVGTELCRTELPPAVPGPAGAPRGGGRTWPAVLVLLILGSTLRAVGFFIHTGRREWPS